MWYHNASNIERNCKAENKPFRRLVRQLEYRKENPFTVICTESPMKDIEKIRKKEIDPTEEGIYEVPSESKEGSRLWGVHGKSLHPIKATGECRNEDFLAFKSSEFADFLIDADKERPLVQTIRDAIEFEEEMPSVPNTTLIKDPEQD